MINFTHTYREYEVRHVVVVGFQKLIDPAIQSVKPPSDVSHQSMIKTRSQHDDQMSSPIQNRINPKVKGIFEVMPT